MSTSTVPSLEASGQLAGPEVKWIGVAPASLVRPIWAGVQAPRPLAEEGLTTRPLGRVTTAVFKVGGG